jgi:hypothetical protein
MREQDLTRRSILHGAAVLGAATLLVRPHQTPTVGEGEGSAPWGRLSGHGGTGPGSATGPGAATARGLHGLVGATVSPIALGTRTWAEAARKFDATVGRPMAVTASRLYFNHATINAAGLYLVRMMAATGVTTVISFMPSRNLRRSEITNLQRSIRQCRAAGMKIESVCLWHEPNNITRKPMAFPKAQEYIDYVRYYGPAVTGMGIPLSYIPVVLTTDGTLQNDYFPGTTWLGQPLVARIYPNFYCASQYIHGARMDGSIRLSDK